MSAGCDRTIAQIRIESAARVDSEWLFQVQMQPAAGGRVHVEFIDGATDCVEEVRPRFQSFRCNTATAGFGLSVRPAIKERHARACSRELLRRERSGWAGPDD